MAKFCSQGTVEINQYLDQQEEMKRMGQSHLDAELERHLASCEACREEYNELEGLFAALATAPMLEPPAGFTARVMAKLPRPEREPLSGWVLPVGVLTLTLASIVFLTFIFGLSYLSNKVSLIRIAAGPALDSLWQLLKTAVSFVVDLTGAVFNLLRGVGVLIAAYPGYFITLCLTSMVMLILTFWMINLFQRQHYLILSERNG